MTYRTYEAYLNAHEPEYDDEYDEYDEPDEPNLDLHDDFNFDDEDRRWYKTEDTGRVHTATVDHKDGQVKKGEVYRVWKTTHVDDVTGLKTYEYEKRVVGRTSPLPPPFDANLAEKHAPWERVSEHWDGAVTVRSSGPSPRVRELTIDENHPALADALGEELAARVVALVRWGWNVGLLGAGAGPCPDPLVGEMIKAGDWARKPSHTREHWGVHYGTLCACKCGQVRGVYNPRKNSSEDTELEAFLLAMASYGNSAHNWDNAPPPLHVCDCAAKAKVLAKLAWPASIVEDSGWKGTSGGRCIVDYRRTLTFERPLTEDEKELVVRKIRSERNPGNGHPGIASGDNQVFRLGATHDSSD